MKRRDFLKGAAIASTAPFWGRMSAYANETGPAGVADRFLLMIFLSGGNDGLNTVVPLAKPAYARHRPNLALKPETVLDMGIGYGLHPSLPFIHQQCKAGRVAVVHSVSYPRPDFSHFRSTEFWDTGSPERRWYSGWVGRYIDSTEGSRFGPVRAVGVGPEMPRMLAGEAISPVVLDSLPAFTYADKAAIDAAARRRAYAAFSATVPAETSLRRDVLLAQRRTLSAMDPIAAAARAANGAIAPGDTVAHLFAAGVGAEVGFIKLGSFDTHTDQLRQHATLLANFDGVVQNFFATATRLGIADRATVLAFSEFGRRVPENYGLGTDHGAAGPAFVIGPRVKGGAYGPSPNLTNLVDGNLRMGVDFRSVYASLIEQVLRVPSAPLLGAQFPLLPLVS